MNADRNNMTKTIVLGIGSVGLIATALAGSPRYVVTDLDEQNLYSWSKAYGINELGQVTGEGHDPNYDVWTMPFRWDPYSEGPAGGEFITLPLVVGSCAYDEYPGSGPGGGGRAITDSGEIAGWGTSSVYSGVCRDRAYYWDPFGQPMALPFWGDSPSCDDEWATDINASGKIVGVVADSYVYSDIAVIESPVLDGTWPCPGMQPWFAAVWGLPELSGPQLLDDFDLVAESAAYGVNEEGVVVGWWQICDPNEPNCAYPLPPRHASYWSPEGDAVELKGVGDWSTMRSEARDINTFGWVVGCSEISPLFYRACLWPDGDDDGLPDVEGVVNLDLGAEVETRAYALNDSGLIVGSSNPVNGATVAVAWERTAPSDWRRVNLNTRLLAGAGWWLTDMRDVNNSGQIVGWGHRTGMGTSDHAVLLTPIDTCPSDLDGDLDVDLADLAALLAGYGSSIHSGDGREYAYADIDDSGRVDLADLAALLADYGSTCPSAELPGK